MARGNPDYGVGDFITSQTNIDTTDVIATSIGFGRIDGMGRIWSISDFRDGFNDWTSFKVNTGSLPVHYFGGGKGGSSGASVKCVVNAKNDESGIYNRMILPYTRRMGVEVIMRVGGAVGTPMVEIDGVMSNGSPKKARVTYNCNNQYFSIYSGGVETNITPFYDLGLSDDVLIQFKLVVDVVNLSYYSFLVGGFRADLSSYPLFAYAGGQEVYNKVVVKNASVLNAGVEACYFGAVIVTVDEP